MGYASSITHFFLEGGRTLLILELPEQHGRDSLKGCSPKGQANSAPVVLRPVGAGPDKPT